LYFNKGKAQKKVRISDFFSRLVLERNLFSQSFPPGFQKKTGLPFGLRRKFFFPSVYELAGSSDEKACYCEGRSSFAKSKEKSLQRLQSLKRLRLQSLLRLKGEEKAFL